MVSKKKLDKKMPVGAKLIHLKRDFRDLFLGEFVKTVATEDIATQGGIFMTEVAVNYLLLTAGMSAEQKKALDAHAQTVVRILEHQATCDRDHWREGDELLCMKDDDIRVIDLNK